MVLPIKPGNKWLYSERIMGYNYKRLFINKPEEEIYRDNIYFLIEDHELPLISYFPLTDSNSDLQSAGKRYCRVDNDGNYFYVDENFFYDSLYEYKYYIKGCKTGDKWEQKSWQIEPIYLEVKDTFTTVLFNEEITMKYLLVTDSGLSITHQYWNDKFGLISYSNEEWGMFRLIGCEIDGVVYGDTSYYPVDVKNKLVVPLSFGLSQNYPNPFNPVTTITYQIPKEGLVTLKVYDILGNEIRTLVNEYKPSGRYKAEFDASRLASGMYLYRLRVNEYVSTKKMLLLK